MIHWHPLVHRPALRRAGALALCGLIAGACDTAERLSPAAEDTALPETTVATDSSTLSASFYTGATAPGVAFASFDLPLTMLGSTHTGAYRTPDKVSILNTLSAGRAKGARMVLKLSGGSDSHVKNSDGTFSFTKWKAMVDRFKGININSYINDGTILGHYLIDEPYLTSRWKKPVPQSTVEAMAKYSKQIWPGMTTMVRVVPSWLDDVSIRYVYLDAAWAQYAARKGDAAKWIASEVAAAKAKGLGLVASLNVLKGGSRGGNMTATELKNYGTALLNQSYVCGFLMWQYNSSYFGRSDIKSAMSTLSSKARNHTRTSCRQ
jgi:hypothetical protein